MNGQPQLQVQREIHEAESNLSSSMVNRGDIFGARQRQLLDEVVPPRLAVRNFQDHESEENKEDQEEAEEDLGSELSGMSVEIPIEIEQYENSGSYLIEYERICKSGVMQLNQHRKRSGPHLFES